MAEEKKSSSPLPLERAPSLGELITNPEPTGVRPADKQARDEWDLTKTARKRELESIVASCRLQSQTAEQRQLLDRALSAQLHLATLPSLCMNCYSPLGGPSGEKACESHIISSHYLEALQALAFPDLRVGQERRMPTNVSSMTFRGILCVRCDNTQGLWEAAIKGSAPSVAKLQCYRDLTRLFLSGSLPGDALSVFAAELYQFAVPNALRLLFVELQRHEGKSSPAVQQEWIVLDALRRVLHEQLYETAPFADSRKGLCVYAFPVSDNVREIAVKSIAEKTPLPRGMLPFQIDRLGFFTHAIDGGVFVKIPPFVFYLTFDELPSASDCAVYRIDASSAVSSGRAADSGRAESKPQQLPLGLPARAVDIVSAAYACTINEIAASMQTLTTQQHAKVRETVLLS